MHNFLTWLLRSRLARALYVILFYLKPLIEDANLQVYMYCVHARKIVSDALRIHFRAHKISKFLGGVPPDPPSPNLYCGAQSFLFALLKCVDPMVSSLVHQTITCGLVTRGRFKFTILYWSNYRPSSTMVT